MRQEAPLVNLLVRRYVAMEHLHEQPAEDPPCARSAPDSLQHVRRLKPKEREHESVAIRIKNKWIKSYTMYVRRLQPLGGLGRSAEHAR